MASQDQAAFHAARDRIPENYKLRERAFDRYLGRQMASEIDDGGKLRRLKPLEREVLTNICNSAVKYGRSWCGPTCLADELGAKVRSIERAIEKLVSAGAIARVRATGKQPGEWWYVPVLQDDDAQVAPSRTEQEKRAQGVRRRLRGARRFADTGQHDLLANLAPEPSRSPATLAGDPALSPATLAGDPSPSLYIGIISHKKTTASPPDATMLREDAGCRSSPFDVTDEEPRPQSRLTEDAGNWLIPSEATTVRGILDAGKAAAWRQKLPKHLQMRKLPRWTDDVIRQIGRMHVDVVALITRYLDHWDKTPPGNPRDPCAYLIKMAQDEVKKRDGISIEMVAKLATADSRQRAMILAGAVGVGPEVSLDELRKKHQGPRPTGDQLWQQQRSRRPTARARPV